MLISYKWLQNYLPELESYSPEQISEALTAGLAEVETFTKLGAGLNKVIVGEVLETEEHPTHKKLKVCKVTTGKEETTIICGAHNVAAGQKVAVCLPGGSVLNPKDMLGKQQIVSITARKIGEVTSNGMICSAKELGLADEHEGILILEEEAATGSDLTGMLSDIVFEIENKSISHRPDCFSHKGIARELAAIMKLNYQEVNVEQPIIPSSNLPISINIKVKQELCPRFSAVVIKDIKVKPSPLWLQFRIAAVGARPVNNIVDITNYVMFDQGQPMHAFDYDQLDNNKVIVRTAKAGEKLRALDGNEYELEGEMMVVADGKRTESIAGVMGGESTEITNTTVNILLEAANWNMYSIRRTSRTLGLRSEASTRFEKGQDPENTINGLKAAIKLILDISDGEIASELQDYYPEPRKPKQIGLDISYVKRFLGIDLNKTDIINYLEGLGLKHLGPEDLSPSDQQQNTEKFQIPTHRPDLNLTQDLMEEIARLFGYSNIPVTLPESDIKPVKVNPVSLLMRKLKSSLTSLGLDEIMSYSFVGEDLYNSLDMDIKKCLKIKNPLSPELGYMRNTLVPSLVSKIEANKNNFSELGFFEINRVVFKEKMDEIHVQPYKLAALVFSKNEKSVYPQLKGVFDQLCEQLGITPEFTPLSKDQLLNPLMHPGRSANIMLGEDKLGVIGELHPKHTSRLGLENARVAVLEVDFDLILNNYRKDPKYHKLSDFQEVQRDLSFWLNKKTPFADMRKNLEQLETGLIRGVELIDIYESDKDTERVSYTIQLRLQSYEKTLTEDDINATLDKVTAAIQKLGGELRK